LKHHNTITEKEPLVTWRIRSTFAAVVAIMALAQNPAHATVTYYTDPAAFAAASTGTTTIDFGNALPPGNTDGSFVTVDGVEFGTNPGFMPNILINEGLYLEAPNGSMVMGLPANTTAVGFEYLPLLNGAIGVSLADNSDAGAPPDNFVVSSNDPSDPIFVGDHPAFLGIVSSVPMSSVDIIEAGIVNVNNVTFGKQVPEPSSFVLAALAVATLCYARRRRA
jgi:hypothetical protein